MTGRIGAAAVRDGQDARELVTRCISMAILKLYRTLEKQLGL